MPIIKEKPKGYLEDHFHMFYLEDKELIEVDYHFHTFHKCLVVLEGELDYDIEGREYLLKKDDIIIVPNYEAHRLKTRDEMSYKRLVIYFSDTLIDIINTKETPIRKLLLSIGKNIPNHIPVNRDIRDQLKEIEISIIKYMKFKDFGSDDITLALFIKWLVTYFSVLNSIDDKVEVESQDQVIQVSINYIKQNIDQILSIEALAKNVYLSKYYFMRKFKEVTGVSVHQYIINERLTLARKLMKEDIPLTKVSYMVGFRDYSTFGRAFKKKYIHSPREFMKLLPTKP